MICYYFTSEFFQQLVTYYSCIIYRFYVFSWFFFHYILLKSFLFPTICTRRWRSRRTCTHLLLRELQNYNSLLNNHQLENVGSHQKKRYPMSRDKGEAIVRRQEGQNHIQNQTSTHQKCSEGSNKTLCPLGDPTETEIRPLSV